MPTSKSIVLSLLVSVSAGFTQPGPPHPIVNVHQILDADGDHVISAQEIANAHRQLRKLDINSDGRITENEITVTFPEGHGPGGPGGPGGRGGPGSLTVELVRDFDKDGDGFLNLEERTAARAERPSRGGRERGRGGPGGRGRGGPGGQRDPATPGPQVAIADAKIFPQARLYDPAVLRTLFLEFESKEWDEELKAFKGTDVEVPAKLTVDGKTYRGVGVHYRGMSSYSHVPEDYKRSFNLSIDHVDSKQRLYGYQTLNLLNCNGDQSMMSSALFSHVANPYLPAPMANFVNVVVNGESWGVYANVQQFNKDFLKEHYGSSKGARWKVSGNPRADGGLRYVGDDVAEYRSRFEIKSKDTDESWQALIKLCKTLNETPQKKLEEALEPMLNIDGVLRFLAMDIAVVNSDGYWTRASDYNIYRDPNGVFHILPHDMNEAFRGSRGPGGRGGPGGEPGRPGRGGPPGHGGPDLDPLTGLDNERMPLRSKLLNVPNLRERYLQYVRDIARNGLDWKNISPVIARYRGQLKDEIALDTRKLGTLAGFLKATAPAPAKAAGDDHKERGDLHDFAMKRQEYLLQHKEIIALPKQLASITYRSARPKIAKESGGKKPAPKSAPNGEGTLVINEIMASNSTSVKDPQGEYEDWIELHNRGTTERDLSGMYLSDSSSNIRKWKFPAATVIAPGGFLIIWADEDKPRGTDLHANFKLSKDGESLYLTDRNDRVLDHLKFKKQRRNAAYGRYPDGAGKTQSLLPSPSQSNRVRE
ncbi:MAG: spore coat protein CotH [Limisphaerales bacterium]|jgi:spore coat protein CotH